ncbi:MAG: DNA repair protein RecN [Magnetospiraceae bacterium]
MLLGLSIRDVVLIDRLDLEFGSGLCVLTGETGAGKSILLDALGLALGGRSEARLVRKGAERASVTAVFDPPPGNAALTSLLTEHDLTGEQYLMLRRTVGTDGRSRAHVNDRPVSIALLRELGDLLVEVHGQHETHGLLDGGRHAAILDAYGRNDSARRAVAQTHGKWREAVQEREAAEATLAAARAEEDYCRHVVETLSLLAPEPGEETSLAEKRGLMMKGEKLLEGLTAATSELTGKGGVEAAFQSALRHLERIAPMMEGKLDEAISALDRASVEAFEALATIERIASDIDLDPAHLESVEERLFALRAEARKHNVPVDDLAGVLARHERQLALIDGGAHSVDSLRAAEAEAWAAFGGSVAALRSRREAAAKRLDMAVAAELPALKLEKARFETAILPLPDAQWGPGGGEQVVFQVATNPGSDPGPLAKIASGGELARFMLALKVVLTIADPVPTLVFDEVDAGIGGATAAAVGDRLAQLGQGAQVLVVTHSPQVAARGVHHWRVQKAAAPETRTTVVTLPQEARLEEIARMLSGAEITEEARAAAGKLLEAVAS